MADSMKFKWKFVNIRWSRMNKWLYIGKWIIELDNWLNWTFKAGNHNTFNLFSIDWDNCSWWGRALMFDEEELECYFQITIIGIGIRYNYTKKIVFLEKPYILPKKR